MCIFQPIKFKDRSVIRMSHAEAPAFTLIEMLVVVSIIALIVAAMAPMVFSAVASSRLSTAGQSVAATISYARQKAISSNQEVEVRFFAYDDPDRPGTDVLYTAVGLFANTDRSAKVSTGAAAMYAQQIGSLLYLPSGIAFGANTTLSPFLAGAQAQLFPDRQNSISKANAQYKKFSIYPDGTTDLRLGTQECYVTLVEERYAIGGAGELPRNFFAIQFDRMTGRATTYRP